MTVKTIRNRRRELLTTILFLIITLFPREAYMLFSPYHGQQSSDFAKYENIGNEIPSAAVFGKKWDELHHDLTALGLNKPEFDDELNEIPIEDGTKVKHEFTSEAPKVDVLKCPMNCVCQNARLEDLAIYRWINHIQGRYSPSAETDMGHDNYNENTNDNDMLAMSWTKQATCILQDDTDVEDLITNLPQDLQALILLYTGVGKNKTVNVSVLQPLTQLSTLEVRGPEDRTFNLVFDQPLSFIQYANFESLTLLGSESSVRPNNPEHPSNHFDYKPKSELYTSYKVANGYQSIQNISNMYLDFEIMPDDSESNILPYNEYIIKKKKDEMPTFYGWSQLEILRVHDCPLDELHWEMFDGLDNLKHFSFERNNIKLLHEFALYGALNMKTVSLAYNQIHDLHYRSLGGLHELEVLDLSNNRLTKLSELSFPPFARLKKADFRGNPLHYIFPATFWVMNNTRAISFGSREASLELWNNEPFGSLNKLVELNLDNVSIASFEHSLVKGLPSLQILKVHGTIGRIEFDAFAGLNELKYLDLSRCNLREISMDSFIGLSNLRTLNLSHNNISYIPPGLLDDQKLLREIYLNNNQLKTLPMNFFRQSALRIARLNENPWYCSCDMINWPPKITNQKHDKTIKRCISDYATGAKIACRLIDSYKFDHSLAPRCNNYNGRSLFYVLRKQLPSCKLNKIVERRVKSHIKKEKKGTEGHRSKPSNSHKMEISNEVV